jgi:ribosome-binding protein aMBF1 (putative translation factor)
MSSNPLDRYLRRTKKAGVNERTLARAVGVHYSRINRYRSGESIPMPDVAASLEKATGGQVKASYWEKRARSRRKGHAAPVEPTSTLTTAA